MALEAIPRAVALMGDRIILTLSNMRLLRLSSSSTLRQEQEPPLAQYQIRPRPRLIPTPRMGTHSSSSSNNNKVLW